MSHFFDKIFRRLRIKGKHNVVQYVKNKDGYIKIRGNDNSFICKNSQENLTVIFCGNNNKLVIEENVMVNGVTISIGRSNSPVENCSVYIGKNTLIGKNSVILLMESNSYVHIGENCMFAANCNIWCTDAHAIMDLNGNITNIGKSVEIGNHVWVGADVKIGKNTKIMDHCIVGWNSVVSRKFDEANVIIAGNPATIVKKNITWDKNPTQTILGQN